MRGVERNFWDPAFWEEFLSCFVFGGGDSFRGEVLPMAVVFWVSEEVEEESVGCAVGGLEGSAGIVFVECDKNLAGGIPADPGFEVLDGRKFQVIGVGAAEIGGAKEVKPAERLPQKPLLEL